MLKTILFLILFFSFSISAKDNLILYKLKNGMDVLLIPDNKSELIVHSVFYKVGGLQDFYGKAGLAHFLEHLMFRSTKNHKSGELIDFFDNNGMIYNAATGHELTFYYEFGRKELLEDLMKFESDRMQNLVLKDDEINKERGIVKEERRMRVDNVPEEKFLEKLSEIYYNNGYYGQSLIGSMNDLNAISNQDFRNFYYKYYNPNNAILVVAGNIDIKKTKKLVEKYYGSLKNNNHNLVECYRNSKPEINKANLVFRQDDKNLTQSNYYYMANGSTFASKKQNSGFINEFLAYIVENGDRMLKKKLIEEKKIASNVSVQYNSFGYDKSPFLIKITPIDDSKIKEIEEFMRDFFKSSNNIISNQELKRLKNLYIGQNIYMMDNLQAKNLFYGQAMVIGLSPHKINNIEKYIKRITVSDLNDAYRELFVKNNHIVGIFVRG